MGVDSIFMNRSENLVVGRSGNLFRKKYRCIYRSGNLGLWTEVVI